MEQINNNIDDNIERRFPMKVLSLLITMAFILFVGTVSAGTFVSGSTGADGAFNPTTNYIELQLPPNGIFNFTTVTIPSNVTVAFKKNAANTPVYILATGDVTIAGTINVNGWQATDNFPGRGGPGGYDGGYGGIPGMMNGLGGNGLGPGAGIGSPFSSSPGFSGGYSTPGPSPYPEYPPSAVYGNSRIIPVIGGSGGGGGGAVPSTSTLGYGGSGGGGAILIASSGTMIINGSIIANGGDAALWNYYISGGAGSGGAVKLIANAIAGSGTIRASGGSKWLNDGGQGRIRMEAYKNSFASITAPPAYTYGLPGSVFLANTPSLSITSIGGVTVSSNPAASYITPDIALPSTTTNPVTVALSASNIPLSATITVSAIPQFGAATNVTTTLSGTDASSTATASVNLATDIASVIMAYTTYTLQTAMYWEGEKIDKVRVAASMGKGSKTVYITASGKEIPAEIILAGLMK